MSSAAPEEASTVPASGEEAARAQRVNVLAIVTVALHALGLALAAIGMRPGTDLVPHAERMAYLASAPLGWSLGWGVWMLCAFSLVAFLFFVARATGDPPLQRLAMMLAVAGLGADLICDTIHIRVTPALAAANDPRLLIALDALATTVGAVVANGLYSIAILLVSACLWRRGATLVMQLGLAVFAFGMLMVVAGFDAVPSHLELATGPAIALFSAWALAVARFISRPVPRQ